MIIDKYSAFKKINIANMRVRRIPVMERAIATI